MAAPRRARAARLLSWIRTMVGVPQGSAHATDFQSLGPASEGLESEYQRVVIQQLQRWGITANCAIVRIEKRPPRGRKESFAAVICLATWERNAALRLLLGLPLLEAKVRKAVQGLWLADVSVFEGLLLQVSESAQDQEAATELRQLIVSLTGPKHTYSSRRPEGITIPI